MSKKILLVLGVLVVVVGVIAFAMFADGGLFQGKLDLSGSRFAPSIDSDSSTLDLKGIVDVSPSDKCIDDEEVFWVDQDSTRAEYLAALARLEAVVSGPDKERCGFFVHFVERKYASVDVDNISYAMSCSPDEFGLLRPAGGRGEYDGFNCIYADGELTPSAHIAVTWRGDRNSQMGIHRSYGLHRPQMDDFFVGRSPAGYIYNVSHFTTPDSLYHLRVKAIKQ